MQGSPSSIFFSIVIPTYNRADILPRAIQSVLAQTYENFEVLIVDDGSTDSTEQTVRSIDDARIRYLKKENEERSIARNYGVNRSVGRYINFLDSDDIFYPHHLQTAYQLLEENSFPAVGHLGYELVDETGNTVFQRNDLDDRIPERMIHENVLHANAIFIRKDIASQYSFIPSKEAIISEDWYLWMRLVTRFQIFVDNSVTSAIVDHQSRSLKAIDPNKLISSTKVVVASLKQDSSFLKKYKRQAAYFFANQYTLVTLVLALAKNRRLDTILYLFKAIREDWTVVARRRFLASIKHWF